MQVVTYTWLNTGVVFVCSEQRLAVFVSFLARGKTTVSAVNQALFAVMSEQESRKSP